jgi:signal transduction histidine kinase
MVLGVPMVMKGRVSGFIGIRYYKRREFPPEEIKLSLALAQQVALAVQLTRLSHESRETAVAAERIRIARDIHDTLAQGFTGVIAQLQAAKGSKDLADIAAHIELAEDLARSSLGEARRSVMALRPRSLRDASLSTAMGNTLRAVGHYSGLKTHFTIAGEPRPLSPEWEEALLRIVQESLTNTIKHAKAQNVQAEMGFGPRILQLKLSDDGCGFDPQIERDGFGLIGIRERVHQMGGSFLIHSQTGHGTIIIITVPCASKPEPSIV